MTGLSLDDLLTLDEFEQLARHRLPHMVYEFIAGAAADEMTLRWNRDAYGKLRLRPRVLEDVSSIDTSVVLFGRRHPSPILLAPVAYQRLMHDDGEVAAARGARAAGVPFVMSTASNSAVEAVAAAAGELWLQLYLQSDREVTRDLVQRATTAGVRALCLTVDTPVLGTRNRQQRARFTMPADLPTPHLDSTGRGRLSIIGARREGLTWRDFAWLRSITTLPILLKGILDPDDATRAIEEEADGIIVSNHGGRNLDTVPATIDALPHIAERVNRRVPLLVDGGIRRGTDIVKALALGADAVLIGRPYAWGLAVAGEQGVARVVAILREELETAMALLGRSSVAQLDRSALWTLG